MSLREWIFRRAIAQAMAKRAPERIPLTGERLMQRDYFSVTLSGLAEGDVLVTDLAGDNIRGRAWVPTPEDAHGRGEYAMPVAIPTARAARATAHYTYYLREHEFAESRSAAFLFRLETGCYRRQAQKEERRQGQYNRQALERRKRMDLLQWLTDHAVAGPSGEGAPFHSPLDILTQQHGRRWLRHPAARETLNYTGLLLRSLHHDELVEFDGHAGYRVLPAALGVLESFMTDERRHNDSELTQRRLYWVAFAAGAAATVQAGAALWSIVSPPQQPEPRVDTRSAPAAPVLSASEGAGKQP